jgi:5-methylcytosine-specific restriction endonuclease McrA
LRVTNAPTADLVFVLSKQGAPLMPCSPGKARKLLEAGKAKVIRRTPFVIQLLFGSAGYVGDCIGGNDTGSKRAGFAVRCGRRVLYTSEVELRNDIRGKMDQRRMYRKSRRSRKTRYRPARFDNRRGRIAPTFLSKRDAHLREIQFIKKILPIKKMVVETAKFDIHAISHPEKVSKRHGWSYQRSQQYGFYNTKAYVLHRDEYSCQNCKAKEVRLQVHHIQFRSEGGTNTPDNLITLCHSCHDGLHEGKVLLNPEKLLKKAPSKTKHAVEENIICSLLKKSFLNTGLRIIEAFGFETKLIRESLGLKKTHHLDAVAVTLLPEEEVNPINITDSIYLKRCVSKGDYQQTSGARSEQKIPTGKLFGLRKFDSVQTTKGAGFIKGKRSTGFFALMDINGIKITDSVNVKKGSKRLSSRKSVLIERRQRLLLDLKVKVSAAENTE